MKRTWYDEVDDRLMKDDTYLQWQQSLKVCAAKLKTTLTDAQLDLFSDCETSLQFIGMTRQEFGYTLGVEHGWAEAQKS